MKENDQEANFNLKKYQRDVVMLWTSEVKVEPCTQDQLMVPKNSERNPSEERHILSRVYTINYSYREEPEGSKKPVYFVSQQL